MSSQSEEGGGVYGADIMRSPPSRGPFATPLHMQAIVGQVPLVVGSISVILFHCVLNFFLLFKKMSLCFGMFYLCCLLMFAFYISQNYNK